MYNLAKGWSVMTMPISMKLHAWFATTIHEAQGSELSGSNSAIVHAALLDAVAQFALHGVDLGEAVGNISW